MSRELKTDEAHHSAHSDRLISKLTPHTSRTPILRHRCGSTKKWEKHVEKYEI